MTIAGTASEPIGLPDRKGRIGTCEKAVCLASAALLAAGLSVAGFNGTASSPLWALLLGLVTATSAMGLVVRLTRAMDVPGGIRVMGMVFVGLIAWCAWLALFVDVMVAPRPLHSTTSPTIAVAAVADAAPNAGFVGTGHGRLS
jgi:hypothetical protein